DPDALVDALHLEVEELFVGVDRFVNAIGLDQPGDVGNVFAQHVKPRAAMECARRYHAAMHAATHLDTDVLVIGAGGAGMYAALEAARLGARVILADRSLIGRGGA